MKINGLKQAIQDLIYSSDDEHECVEKLKTFVKGLLVVAEVQGYERSREFHHLGKKDGLDFSEYM